MSSQCHRSAKWQLFVFAAALLLCIGSLHSASGQIPDTNQLSSPKAPDPPAYPKRFTSKRPDNRSKRTSTSLPQPSPDTHTDNKQQQIEQALELGNQARKDNDYEHALAYYQKVSKDLNPKEARASYGLGNVYSDLYCHDSAIVAYLNALKLKQDYLEALVGLGYAYVNKERYDDAEKQFQSALNIKRNNVDANIGLGTVYAKKGKFQEAIDQINLVINDKSVQDKVRAPAHVALGAVYWKQEKWQETIAQYEKAISLDPDLASTYVVLGAVQMTAAYSKFSSIKSKEVRVQDRERLSASAKQAAGNIEKAMNEHGYKRPAVYLFLGYALMHQARHQDAVSKINTYLAKVKELEDRLTSIDTNIPTQCDYGFSRFKADGYWNLGFVYLDESSLVADNQRKTELLDEAGANFKQAIKLKQDYAEAYGMLGLTYFQQGKYEEAIGQYEKEILYTTEEKSRAQAYEIIRLAYLQKGNAEEARGKSEEAIEQYQKAILYAKEESGKAQVYRSIGLAYASLKRYDAAVSNVQEAIKSEPNNPSVYESLATIYVIQGNIEETFKALKKAEEVRTTPATNPDPYYYLGTAYAIRFLQKGGEGDFNAAVKWLKKAVEIRPGYIAAYYSLGAAYQAHSNTDEAIASYEEAIKYDPKNPDNYLKIAQGYFELKQNDEAAIEYLKQAIKLKPDYAEAYWRLGQVYHHKKDDAEAIKLMLEAIKYDPKDLQAYLGLAYVYKDQKNYTEATKYLNKAAGVAPRDFRPYKELAKVYEEQQKNEEAIHYYEEALKLLDTDAWAKNLLWTKNLYLGRISRLRGRYDEAISYFQKLPQPPTEKPGQTQYDIGLTHVASRNKKAALEQYQQLVQLKSPLADELRNKINEMK